MQSTACKDVSEMTYCMLSEWDWDAVSILPRLHFLLVNVQVVKRLTAAGSHLSFVAQPAPLIVEMKRRLKTMKYFKDYLIE